MPILSDANKVYDSNKLVWDDSQLRYRPVGESEYNKIYKIEITL